MFMLGWIADYPVTPDIIGELQSSIGAAADSGRLALNKDAAMMALQVSMFSRVCRFQWALKVRGLKLNRHRVTGSIPILK
jgi:hypothetical protein